MSTLKKLASETALYGITHTIGRLLNFLLVPLYTKLFLPEEYGVISVLYSVVGFANVLLLYGMETAFFSFTRKHDARNVYTTAFLSVVCTSILFILFGSYFSPEIAQFLEYPEHTGLIRLFVVILALDALSALPLAWLRYENRPLRFAIVRLSNILLNIGANLFFLLFIPQYIQAGHVVSWYDPGFGIGYIVLSNLLASAIMFLMLLPQWGRAQLKFDRDLWKSMFRYAYPLIFVGLAGIVNETLDRVLLKKLLPDEIADFEVGVYSAFYKLSIVMTLFVQAFRFGAEPFFFRQSEGKDATRIYARIMHYFVIVTVFIYLATTAFLPDIAPVVVRGASYFNHPQALRIVPVLLLANLFLGILYNLNFWYKLSNRTAMGMWVSIGGALLTIALNVILIPVIGIMGSAVATLVVYFSMSLVSFLLGRRFYPIPYRLAPIAGYLVAGIGLSYLIWQIRPSLGQITGVLASVGVCAVYLVLVFGVERPHKKM